MERQKIPGTVQVRSPMAVLSRVSADGWTGKGPGWKGKPMNKTMALWSHRDLRFVVETLIPERADAEHVVDLLRDDVNLLDAMLQDDRLFEQLMDDEQGLVSVSPLFFFRVLLLRARRDLQKEIYTIEHRQQQKVVLFDANRVVDLLDMPEVSDYLATMLASYTRTNSTTIPIRVRQGVWQRVRVSDLDVDSLIRYAQLLDEEQRFWAYRRIGDASLFLTSIFPEHISAQQLYPQSRQPRLRFKGSLFHTLEDFEGYGRSFYRLAAQHPQAKREGLDGVLNTLSEHFILAEKPLTFIAARYLALRKHNYFKL